MAIQPYYVDSTLTALNAVSDEISLRGRHEIFIEGTGWTGTVTMQWNFGKGWHDIASWSTDFVTSDEIGSKIRMRFKMTAYTAGSVQVCIRSESAGG